MSIAGPALAGRISGTGVLERITLGAGLEIINGALSVTGGVGGYSALSMPTGFAVTGSGTASIAVTFASGYRLLTTAEATSWNTAASLAASAIQPGNAALADAREWTAPTASQAEAEAGSSTARLAFTPQRIFQAVAAWWAASTSTVGKALATSADAAAGRATLGAAASGAIGSSGLTMATARLLGRSTAGTGAPEEVSIGSGLSLSGGVLTATTAGAGTVTSVGISAPTGFSVTGSPVTASGTLALAFSAGYSLPTTASQAQWDTAYSERNQWNGGATGLVAATGRTSLGLGSAALSASSDFAAALHTQAASTITGLATVATSGAYADLGGRPTLGTAAPLDVAAAGDASAAQVVKGNDSRLSDARTPTAHNQAASTISDSTAAGRALLTAADAAAQRTTLGAAASGAVTGSGLTMATARLLGRTTASTGAPEEISVAGGLILSAGVLTVPVEIGVACSDETTALTTGTAKVTFRLPYAMTLTAVRASVTTAPTGSTLVVDINEGGTSVISTKLSIDATEKTSTTAATAAVISDSALADDAEITVDIDQIGATIAGAGLKVWLIGRRA
jgi:hypothetical protein